MKTLKIILQLPLIILIFIGDFYNKILTSLKPSLGFFWSMRNVDDISKKYQDVNFSSGESNYLIKYHVPNYWCQNRVDTFLIDEPDTLAWLIEYGKGCVLYDIGANVGMFSIFHSKVNNSRTYAFEPSVFNLNILAKNINLNKLTDLITIIPNPLSVDNAILDFNLQHIDEGASGSSFGVDYGFAGEKINTIHQYSINGFKLDFLLEQGIIKEKPNLIKIDVDGIEHLIIEGALDTLKSAELRSIIIEVYPEFILQRDFIHNALEGLGFSIKSVCREAGGIKPLNTYNQIWVR